MTEIPMERHLLDMPYEVLFEICRELPKGKLFEISRFCNVAKDTRLWKDVYIKYEVTDENFKFAVEELYPGPFPVKQIDLVQASVIPPAFFETDQVVNVTKLNWSCSLVKESSMKAMLAKYQCTELRLYNNYYYACPGGRIMGIAPEAFSKQTGLEVLSLESALCAQDLEIETETSTQTNIRLDINGWLATVLSKYCKNLKSLDLSTNYLAGLDVTFVKNLPTTLEKLYLISYTCPGNSFFELLAEHRPNLKEIGLPPERLECPALLKFKFLEALYINPYFDRDIRDLYKYLIVFPTIKNVYIDIDRYFFPKPNLEALETMVKSHGITIVRRYSISENCAYPRDGNLWLVSKAM